ncbi:bifunctional folylpolyglutamate synthase/dihydrofolate synthase [Alloscardovia theropitheci]|uniref:tetrahydrofolate synthase n=1 Tax=Alloscardovia theropitheci TaxID=2496842 RepID=A0A4R0QX39_9BIFI|nr:folylpolyglutamate synthase/dihydrofolate synthase family protein [Alloscardovia theropitheci]TCD53941.1 bifunctional folylpolyglutamate synthase/dihydrofolate synthase [Alloscardovia theropitheci]
MSYEVPESENLTLAEVYREIMSRAPEHDFDPSLTRMQRVLDYLGHPEQSFRVIHVTGTNGKGSTSRMAEAICRAYGLRTGLYTSPHVESVTERIAIDGQHISDDAFIDTWLQVKDFIDIVDRESQENNEPRMSFFEVLTTMAIWAFADAPVDVAIVEVGMGGRWDATNVLDGDAVVIGPVDMDHMQWLGDTVEEIAQEKAGIIKPNSTVIIGAQPHAQVSDLLVEEAQEVGAQAIVRDGVEAEITSRANAVGGQVVSFTTPQGMYDQIPVAMFGEHQAHNALAALCAAEAVIPVSGQLDTDIIAQALSGVKIPGRIEVIRRSPTIIIDGGHNENAVTALRNALEDNFDFNDLVGVVSMMKDKEVETVLGIMEPVLSQIVVTENSWSSRVMPVEDLEKIAVSVFGPDRVIRADSMPDAIQAAVDAVDSRDELGIGYGHGIIIFGSFVTAGDARILLKERHNSELKNSKEDRAAGIDTQFTQDTGVIDDETIDDMPDDMSDDSSDLS